jgi:hypothetical protein
MDIDMLMIRGALIALILTLSLLYILEIPVKGQRTGRKERTARVRPLFVAAGQTNKRHAAS